jgi:hypothetical protein
MVETSEVSETSDVFSSTMCVLELPLHGMNETDINRRASLS